LEIVIENKVTSEETNVLDRLKYNNLYLENGDMRTTKTNTV
jgi:hypothetical protein